MVKRMIAVAGAAVLLLPLAISPVLGFGKNKITDQRFDWHIYKSPHFDVYYYPAEENLLDDMVSYAESQYMRLSQILDHEIKFRIPLIYYRTHVEFEQTNVILEFIPEAVGAFAEPIENRMVLPADLPLISREDVLALVERASEPPVVVIAPDRHEKGTNALLISPAGLIEYDFGENSFQRHCELVKKAGARLEIVNLPSLGLDLDVPEDLELIRSMEKSMSF